MNRLQPCPIPHVVLVAMALVAGTAFGRLSVWWWCWFLVAATIGGGLAWRPPSQARWLILAAVAMLGAGWSGLHRQAIVRDDLMLATGYATDPVLVHLQGRVGSVAGIRMQLHVTHWLTREGVSPVSGRVVIRLPSLPDVPLSGREVRVKGWLNPIDAAQEGEPDWKSLALDGNYRGWMRLASPDLLEIVDRAPEGLVSWRSRLQLLAATEVLDAPVPRHGRARSLLAALLLGQRDHKWPEVAPPFRRLGVAHLLAISGMHLGLLAGMVLAVVRLGSGPRWWQGWIVLVVVGVYLSVVELRPPIVRAGVMAALACVGLLNRRRLTGIGLLSVAAILVLVAQPGQVARPGFQLSFGVVAGLLLLASRVRRRWFGPRLWTASSPAEVLGQWSRDAIAASVTAWLISVPLVIGHFGQFAPLAVLMSLVLLPPVAAMLALGALRSILGSLPGVGDALGMMLVSCAEAVLALVDFIDHIPGTSVEELEVTWAWVVCAMTWVVAWCVMQRRRNLLLPALILLAAWLVLASFGPDPGA